MSSAFFVPLATSRLIKQMNFFCWPKRNYIVFVIFQSHNMPFSCFPPRPPVVFHKLLIIKEL